MDELVLKTKEFVKEFFENEKSGHDWWHTYRVYKMALNIAKVEKADLFIVGMSALLHDVDDYKITGNKPFEDVTIASKLLDDLEIPKMIAQEIKDIILGVSFKGAAVVTEMKSLEGKIVQDADRLDAIGAIGISRAFTFGGNRGREIHNPYHQPQLNQTEDKYTQNKGTTINHFYEKLLLLKDRMNTETAKHIAAERHEYLVGYLNRFYDEWEGLI